MTELTDKEKAKLFLRTLTKRRILDLLLLTATEQRIKRWAHDYEDLDE